MDARAAAAACSGAKVTSFEHAHTTVTWRLLITCYMTSTSGVKMTIAAVLSWIAIKNYSIKVYTCAKFPPEIVLITEYSASQRGSSTAYICKLHH